MDTFVTEFVPVDKYDFNERNDATFYGVYASRKLKEMKSGYDLYWLAKEFKASDRYTTGLRWGGKCGDSGVDYDFEAGVSVW